MIGPNKLVDAQNAKQTPATPALASRASAGDPPRCGGGWKNHGSAQDKLSWPGL
jgi:hypothetical protein